MPATHWRMQRRQKQNPVAGRHCQCQCLSQRVQDAGRRAPHSGHPASSQAGSGRTQGFRLPLRRGTGARDPRRQCRGLDGEATGTRMAQSDTQHYPDVFIIIKGGKHREHCTA
ncbi:hypothetical protein NDU88_001102 [Pleurodeles waltl]|uniref:Uncharacterized protein n=1 Tax=Pleurodeles waltl TaxID=8319 RepID=A0AAV7W0H4_PLEWA|nr:hypothetical protein NDU88_001102 [Pleurodeles waltl]